MCPRSSRALLLLPEPGSGPPLREAQAALAPLLGSCRTPLSCCEAQGAVHGGILPAPEAPEAQRGRLGPLPPALCFRLPE